MALYFKEVQPAGQDGIRFNQEELHSQSGKVQKVRTLFENRMSGYLFGRDHYHRSEFLHRLQFVQTGLSLRRNRVASGCRDGLNREVNMDTVKNILLVGVGGQGTILASKILSAGLIQAG